MQLPEGQALRAIYDESGPGSTGRRLDVLADPDGRFVVRDPATGTESRCDGTTVWSLADASSAFVGRVPPGPLDTFALLPPLLAELLHSGSEYLSAAFADPATTDEELPLGCVRISGSDLSIVYDRSIDVVHEYRRPDGLRRRLTALEVVAVGPGDDGAPAPWSGPAVAHRGGTVTVSTTAPVARVEDALAGACFAAHLEHESPVLTYWLDGPGVDGEGLALDRCLAWAQALDADVRVSVDLLTGETVDLRGTTYGD
ncbi:MAG: hypothetical protein JNK12_09415 [Acidimicrobiales bacterium]|nr:hypothetical protein [Acidimicrobiales bacterium]